MNKFASSGLMGWDRPNCHCLVLIAYSPNTVLLSLGTYPSLTNKIHNRPMEARVPKTLSKDPGYIFLIISAYCLEKLSLYNTILLSLRKDTPTWDI